MTSRLTSSSLAGTSRKLVAVGTAGLASMLATMRAEAPRSGWLSGAPLDDAAAVPSALAGPSVGAGDGFGAAATGVAAGADAGADTGAVDGNDAGVPRVGTRA